MTELFDREGILDRVCNDTELLAELIEMLEDDCHSGLQQLGKALEIEDLALARGVIHTLKNAIGNFSHGPTFEILQHFEDAALAGDLSRGDVFLNQLEVEIARLLPAVNRFLADLTANGRSSAHFD